VRRASEVRRQRNPLAGWAWATSLLVAASGASEPHPDGQCGRVYDAGSGKGIPGVQISAALHGTGQTMGATTDSTGFYMCWLGEQSQVTFIASGYDPLILEWPSELKPTEYVEAPCDCPGVTTVLLHHTAPRAEEAVSNWTGIPTMPGAQPGRRAGLGYLYAVPTPFEAVEKWYRETMAPGGWSVSERYRSATSLIGGGPTVSLDFTRRDEHVNVILIYSNRERYTMVLLVSSRRPPAGAPRQPGAR
jgi:hypothetical protein